MMIIFLEGTLIYSDNLFGIYFDSLFGISVFFNFCKVVLSSAISHTQMFCVWRSIVLTC